LMRQPLISIIVPIYKVEPYLRKCVDSILAQTYTNIEVILVDDGSPDGCPAICDEYAAKDRRVVVIHQQNTGISGARNAGLDKAKGAYIAFVDDDDWIESDMYELLYQVIKASGTDVAAAHYCIDDDRPTKVSADDYVIYSPKEAIGKFLHGECALLSVWGKLFAREIVEGLRFSTLLFGSDDILFEAQVLVKIRAIAYIGYTCYHYRIRADSVSHAYDSQVWTVLKADDMTIEVIRAFDTELGKCAEKQVVAFDVACANEAESIGKYPDEAHGKVVAHIRRYLTRDTWKAQTFRVKCWLCLLLLGRRPFLVGRKIFRLLIKLRRMIAGRGG